MEASQRLSEMPLLIDDTAPRTIGQLCAAVRLAVRKQGVRVLIVDYLQLIRHDDPRRVQSREQQVAEIASELKMLAKSLDISVIALAQLNRQIENRPNKEPQLSDLRESGAIEQDADTVIFLNRPHVYDHDAPEDFGKLLIRKNRSGSIGEVFLKWRGPYMRFEEAPDADPNSFDVPAFGDDPDYP